MHLAVANSYLNVLCFGEAASQFASSECPRWDPEARRVDVRSIEQCLLAVDTQPVAFVLIDTSDEGYELVRRLRRRAQLGAMPIVFFSPKPLADGEKVRGHSIGATEIVDGVASREIFLIKARYFVSVFREVGRMKERAALQAERLERSNRELEHFASTASHDLQEPLRTVTTYLALLERKYARRFDAEAEALIGSALQGAKRMSSLIDDLLRYTKLSRKEPRQETFDAASPLEEAIDNLHSAIEESGAKIHCDGKLPELIGDRSRIRQLFQNLLSNAIKFRGTEKPVIRFGCRRLNADWCFTVTDNGIGFDMKDSDRVFRIFERLQDRREYPGNGMGLPMCQQIVEQHGGRIWAKSRPGEGATFFFTLRASGAVAREESTASTAGGEAGIDPRR